MPIRSPRLHILSAVFILMVLPPSRAVGAKSAGAIVGLVRDASGAVVTGAKVTVTDVDHGIQLTLSTNNEGEYVASPLKIGQYSVTVRSKDSRRLLLGPVQVNIQDRVGVILSSCPAWQRSRHCLQRTSATRNREHDCRSVLSQVVDSASRIKRLLGMTDYAQVAPLERSRRERRLSTIFSATAVVIVLAHSSCGRSLETVTTSVPCRARA